MLLASVSVSFHSYTYFSSSLFIWAHQYPCNMLLKPLNMISWWRHFLHVAISLPIQVSILQSFYVSWLSYLHVWGQQGFSNMPPAHLSTWHHFSPSSLFTIMLSALSLASFHMSVLLVSGSFPAGEWWNFFFIYYCYFLFFAPVVLLAVGNRFLWFNLLI